MNPSGGQPNNSQNFNSGQSGESLQSLPPANFEHLGNIAANMDQNFARNNQEIENSLIPSAEKLTNYESIGNQVSQSMPVQQPIVVPAQPVIQAVPAVSVGSPSITATPAVAADSDKIEQEWVNTAKKIIFATKSDPHAQNAAVADLMRDYIRKRYGKEVGKAPED